MDSRLTPEILADAELPYHVEISRDGKQVTYYTQRWTREDHGGNPKTSLWLAVVNQSDSAHRVTSGEHHDEASAFSPDGKLIAFISDRQEHGKAKDLYTLSVTNHEKVQKLTTVDEHGLVESFRWSPDGSTIVFHACPKEDPSVDVKVYGENLSYRKLWMLNVESKDTTCLFSKDADVTNFDFNRDGSEVAYCTQKEPDINSADEGQEIFTVNLSTLEDKHSARVACRIDGFCWSEQGMLVSAGYELAGLNRSRVLHLLTSSEFKMIGGYGETSCAFGIKSCWGKTVVLAREGMHTRLCDLDGNVVYSTTKTIWNYAASFTGSSPTLAYIEDATGVPAEVYSLAGGSTCRLSSHDQRIAGMKLGKARWVEYTHNGIPTDGYYMIPSSRQADFDDYKPLATVVVVHGGPYARCNDGFDAPMSSRLGPYLLSKGYLVLVPNYRGGAGHGDDYVHAVHHHADVSYEDVAWLVKKGVEEGRIDKDRVAITGCSQGGYISYLAVTRPSTFRFAVAAAAAGVSDWYLDTCTTDFTSMMISLMGYAPWDKEVPNEEKRKSSPVHYAKDVETPILMIHGEDDVRVPVQNAILFQRALKAHGKEFEMAIYPREGHGGWPMLYERTHFIDILNRVERYFAKYMK